MDDVAGEFGRKDEVVQTVGVIGVTDEANCSCSDNENEKEESAEKEKSELISGDSDFEKSYSCRVGNHPSKLIARRGDLVKESDSEIANKQRCTETDSHSKENMSAGGCLVSESLGSENGTKVSYAEKVTGGVGNGVTKNYEVEVVTRPGARSKVHLNYRSFDPGSPITDLVSDVGTVEKLSNCIVGHFLGVRMDFYDVRKEMFKQWECCGLEKMWCTDNGIYLFKFQNTNRIVEILDEGHCHVFGKVMVLKRWHKMQTLSKEAISKVPIWVKLYDLPFEFWLGESLGDNLSKIASRIGRPLYTDMATEKGMRLSYARVCIEIDVSATLPSAINIEIGGDSVDIRVKYQWVPQKCERCGAFGHRDTYCPQNPVQKKTKVVHNLGEKISASSGGDGVKVPDQHWKVVQKQKWDSRVCSSSTREERSDSEGETTALKEKNQGLHGNNSKRTSKGYLAKEKGHLKSGNSFAVLQSLPEEDSRPALNRGRTENVGKGAPKEGNATEASSVRNPEEDRFLFDAFVTSKETITPEPKKTWVESDFPSEWGKSRRKKAANAANLAGPVFQEDPP